MIKQVLGVLVLASVITVGASFAVHAIEYETGNETPRVTEPSTRAKETESKNQATMRDSVQETRRSEIKDRLTDARLKACQARETAIKNIMKRATERGKRHIERFTTIAERVEAFYVKKGKVLASYDQLVADVNAKKAAAEAAVQTTASEGEGFSCSGDNPKEMVGSFKTTIKNQEEAMKAFKTSVKNLIVGVKSVQGTESRTSEGEKQ
jgi:hypothetical protein